MSSLKLFLTLVLAVLITLSFAGCSSLESPGDRAARDYQGKLELAQSHQQNVAYCLNMTRGQMLDQPTLESALRTQYMMIMQCDGLTAEATASGDVYMGYLQPGSSEYAGVAANLTLLSDYLAAVKTEYNSGAAIYNQFWSSINGTMPYL
jgi:hypothetical protein